MANVDNPRGFWPVRMLDGSSVIPMNAYTTAGTIYQGDLVTLGSGGTVTASSANAGVAVVGVAAEYKTTGLTIMVYDNPFTIFGVQCDTGTTPATTDVGATANHVAGSGNTTTLISGHELDASDIGTGQQMRILRLIDSPDNTWAEHADVEVLLVEHALNDTTSI